MNSLGAVEFDEQGNVVNTGGSRFNLTGAYIGEIYYIADNYAFWEDERYKVYHIFKPDSSDPKRPEAVTHGLVVSRDFKHLCPANEIAANYSNIKEEGRYSYLRGDCDKAHPGEYKGSTHWTYPRDTFPGWVVQRFEDPKEPIYDDYSGKCLLYCAPK